MMDAAEKDERAQDHDETETVSMVDAVCDLVDVLQQAARKPAPAGMDAVKETRCRYISALDAVGRFVKRSGIGKDVEDLILSLALNLKDLENGTQAPELTARGGIGRGRRLDSTEHWHVRDLAVMGLECLIISEPMETPAMALAQAAKKIARQYPGIQNACRPGVDLKSGLESWHRLFNEKRIDSTGNEKRRSNGPKQTNVLLNILQAAHDDAMKQVATLSPRDAGIASRGWLVEAERRAKKLSSAEG
jgi:hypothetical protein